MLSNGYAYTLQTAVGGEGWTSDSYQGSCPAGTTSTFTFICNATASTVQLTAASARVFSDPTQCQYIVQLQTSLACQGSSSFLPSPTSASAFGGLGYDLGSLTGYDIFSAESGNYNGQFSAISFCITMYDGPSTTPWVYSARGAGAVSYTSGSVTNPSGTVVLSQLFGSVLSSANGAADVAFNLTTDDGGNNLLNIAAGSTQAYPNGGGVTAAWNGPSGRVFANMFQNGNTFVIDGAGGLTWASGNPTFTITAQYYDSSNPQLISCNTNSPLIPYSIPYNPSVTTVVAYYYYINLAGTVQDPTCQQYAPGSMVCQRWLPNVCTDTEVAAVWQPTVLAPSWTYINGANYSGGIQLSLLSAPPVSLTHTGVSELSCYGTMVRLQFTCSSTTLRPYVASSYKSVSASNACVFTFIIPTYLLCTAPGQPSLPAPVPTVANCQYTVGGYTYNLAPLGLYDISAYDASGSGTQYVYRPCGVVANGFGQSTVATQRSQLIAIPAICTQPGAAVALTSIAGTYSPSTATWAQLPAGNGVQLSQATGASCVATCGNNVVYNGTWQSVVQFVCAGNAVNVSSRASASVGSYDASCNPVNGGSCTLTFTSYTTNACNSSSPYVQTPGSCGLSAGGATFDFSSLSSVDLYGTDGSAGSNEDSFYVARICGSVSDSACLAAAGSAGSMVCQHAFPYYNQVPNAGTVGAPSSALCSQNLTSMLPAYTSSQSSTTWSLINATLGVTYGVQMKTTAATGCPSSVPAGGPVTVVIQFKCAQLQTSPASFSSVSSNGCTYTMVLYTSLACTAANQAAPAPTAASPAATASNCQMNGVSFASLAVDMNATDEVGRTYVIHPCGAVTSVSAQYCSYPDNTQQQPNLYPSACEVTGYCNPSADNSHTPPSSSSSSSSSSSTRSHAAPPRCAPSSSSYPPLPSATNACHAGCADRSPLCVVSVVCAGVSGTTALTASATGSLRWRTGMCCRTATRTLCRLP